MCFDRKMCRRFCGWGGGLAACWLAVGPVGAVELSSERFTEIGFGVSLRPPAAGEVNASPADGAVCAWELGEDYTLSLRVVRSPEAFDKLADVVTQAWAGSWLGLSAAQPRFVNQEPRVIGERPGMVQHAELEREAPMFLPEHERARLKRAPVFYGQSAMKLDPHSLAILEVYAPIALGEQAKTVLDAVTESVEVMTPEEMYRLRGGQIAAARDWKQGFDLVRAVRLAPADAWYSMSRDGQEVGYVRRGFESDPRRVAALDVALADPGVVSASFTVLQRPDARLEVREDAYADIAGTQETWSRQSLLGPAPDGRDRLFENEARPAFWTETGLRDDRFITVVHKSPPDADAVREVARADRLNQRWIDGDLLHRREQAEFEIPERLASGLLDNAPPIPPTQVYLGQVALAVLPTALPRGRAGVYAFYAYDAESGTLALRTYEVRPEGGGGAWVTERPTAGSSPTRHRIDAQGRVAEVILPSGLHLARTTREALAGRWPELRIERPADRPAIRRPR